MVLKGGNHESSSWYKSDLWGHTSFDKKNCVFIAFIYDFDEIKFQKKNLREGEIEKNNKKS